MTVTTRQLPNRVTTRESGNLSGASMLPDNFDPLYAALGIRRRAWTQPQPQKVTR